jgi:hypothetical protein
MPREGSGVRIVVTPIPLASRERSRQEDSHSGRVRTLGKRVKGNLSRVQIPHPPQGVFQPSPMGGDNLIKVVRAFLYFSGMPITIPKSLLLVPKIPSIAVVGLLAAQFLILQSIGGTEPKCTLNVERPHYSTSLSENQNIDAIKLNITSICNVSQKYTQLSASIQKIKNNREITAYSFVNERRSSTTKSPNVASFKELFGPCQKGVSAAYRGTAQGYVYLENGKKLAVKGDSGKFVAAGCLIGAQ